MSYRNRNLQSLVAEFRDSGMAIKGFKNITKHLTSNKQEELAYLLRHHSEGTVYMTELEKRFEIDTLIEFYNLLLVAALAGYIPAKFEDELTNEIVTVLGNKSVIPYYKKNYPYKMTGFTYNYAKHKKWFKETGNENTINLFNEFAALNRVIKKDEDTTAFMNMLDFVSFGNDDIDEVNEVLGSFNKLNKTFTAKRKSATDQAVWGFIKYTVFIGQLKELLMAAESYPLLQSAMWMFHGYYIDRMNKKMKVFYGKALDNLERALSSPQIFSKMGEELFGKNIPEDFDAGELKQYATSAIEESKKDIIYILNKKWSIPLTEYFSK